LMKRLHRTLKENGSRAFNQFCHFQSTKPSSGPAVISLTTSLPFFGALL
jgi:hypothetical protein